MISSAIQIGCRSFNWRSRTLYIIIVTVNARMVTVERPFVTLEEDTGLQYSKDVVDNLKERMKMWLANLDKLLGLGA